jgi:hypothetical protein
LNTITFADTTLHSNWPMANKRKLRIYNANVPLECFFFYWIAVLMAALVTCYCVWRIFTFQYVVIRGAIGDWDLYLCLTNIISSRMKSHKIMFSHDEINVSHNNRSSQLWWLYEETIVKWYIFASSENASHEVVLSRCYTKCPHRNKNQ